MIIVLHNIISIIKICIFTMFFRYEKEALPRIDELENADAKLKMRLKGIKTISILNIHNRLLDIITLYYQGI